MRAIFHPEADDDFIRALQHYAEPVHLWVLAVMHFKQPPRYWLHRLTN